MNTMGKFLGLICAGLFVLTGVLALFAFNFDLRAFTAETYQKAFAKEDFYNRLPSIMADVMMSSGAGQSQLPNVMQGMNKEGWEAFFRTLLPPETLKLMGDDLLNSTFAYLNMQTDSAQLNLIPLKANLGGEMGAQAVLSLLSTQPACTFEQIAQMTLSLLSGGQVAYCSPPADLYPILIPVIQGQLQFAAGAIPDQVTIISAPPQNDPRQRLQTVRLLMGMSPLLPLAFLFGLTVFAVRSIKSLLSWWGITFFITGALAFVMSLIGAPLFGAILERILIHWMPIYLPAILLDYASDFASVMVQTLINPVLRQGLILAFVGAAMTIGALFIGHVSRQGPQPTG